MSTEGKNNNMTDKRKPLMEGALVGNSSKGSDEISNFRSRLDRLETAKTRQLGIINYIRHICQVKKPELHSHVDFAKLSNGLNSCANYLVFHQYYTVNKVRLAKASFCKNPLLCQPCAIRRGSKQVSSYKDKFDEVSSNNSILKPYLLTLTVKNGNSLPERFEHLNSSVKKMLKRRRDFISSGRGYSQLSKAEGGVFSYELTKSKKGWHPHCHMIVMLDPSNPMDFPFSSRPKKHNPEEWSGLTTKEKSIEKAKWKKWGESVKESELSKEWQRITQDSCVVDLRPVENETDGFIEVFKYALKFSDLTPKDNLEAYSYLKGRRLTGSFGCFWGVKVPEKMTDDLLSDLPYIELFYKYTKAGYSLESADRKEPSDNRYTKKEKAFIDNIGSSQKGKKSDLNSVFNNGNLKLQETIENVISDKKRSGFETSYEHNDFVTLPYIPKLFSEEYNSFVDLVQAKINSQNKPLEFPPNFNIVLSDLSGKFSSD